MAKNRIAITALPLVLLMILSSALTIQRVRATQYLNVEWGNVAPTNNDSTEISDEQTICDYVQWKFSNAGWNAWYAYGADTTASNLQSAIVYRQTHDTYATDFWVGDFHGNYQEGYSLSWGWEWVWDDNYGCYMYEWVFDWFPDPSLQTMHYDFYGTNGDDPHDSYIYGWTNYPYSKQYFTFIGTCACGNVMPDPHNTNNYVYGYQDDINNTGMVGMPIAWLSRGDLSINGYNSPDSSGYCYLGWNSTSLGMSADTGNPNYPACTHLSTNSHELSSELIKRLFSALFT